MNESSLRWYYGGFIGIIIAVLAFELIWLPAPLVMLPQLEWIEVVDWLYYGVLLIPFSWLIGAAISLKYPRIRGRKLQVVIAWLIIIGSMVLMCLLVEPLKFLLLIIAILTIVVLLIAIALFSSSVKIKKLVAIIISYAIVLLLLVCPTGYQVTYPAMTMNMSHYAQFSQLSESNIATAMDQIDSSESSASRSTASKEHVGWIDGVLVFDRPAFPMDWLYAKLLPQVELRKQQADEPSIRETYSQVSQMKRDANQLAAAMAWEFAGKGKTIFFEGAAIVAIVADSPADGVLQAGDVITAVNGHELNDQQALQRYMSDNVKPGEVVNIELRREGETIEVSLTTIAAEQDPARAIMGVVITDKYDIRLKHEVELASYMLHAGGPSHGAMLTLALLDQLTEKDITNGLHVAGTGTIEIDGSVGMVGGIPQKAYAVSRTNADVFFVPSAGAEAARLAAPQLNIVSVDRFEDILDWLERNSSGATQ